MKRQILILISCLLFCGVLSAQDSDDTYRPGLQAFTEDNHFEDSLWFNWGGSIIRGEDQRYYLFYSRWPRQYGFLAWLTHSEIAVASSSTQAGPWTYEYTALKGRRAAFWDAITARRFVRRFLPWDKFDSASIANGRLEPVRATRASDCDNFASV